MVDVIRELTAFGVSRSLLNTNTDDRAATNDVGDPHKKHKQIQIVKASSVVWAPNWELKVF